MGIIQRFLNLFYLFFLEVVYLLIDYRNSFKEKIIYAINRVPVYLHYISLGVLKRKVLIGDDEYTVRNRLGIWKIRQSVGDGLVVSSCFERELVRYFDKVGEGKIAIDIGAHIGKWAVYMAKRGAEVYAFEPDPFNYELLLYNININGVKDKVKAFNIALSDGEREYFFYSEGGFSRIVEKELGGKSFKVKGISMDIFFKKENIDMGKVLLIKMDVEGHEKRVLKGMNRFLEKLNRGVYLIVEMSSDVKDIINFLMKKDFFLLKIKGENYIFKKR